MSEHPRLSDLTGISDAEDDFDAFWPLNIVLVLLGAAILTIAFYFLDPQDQRWFYNPWTYAVATPVVLLVLSALLSFVVSRVVEKSMQMAFLISVIVHLVLLVYAMNVVIFSQMWPDILETLAQERHQLQREALQANQYYRISTSNQSGRRPDYLSHVPTTHQPTELDSADSPALELARSERANLVSPAPRLERSAKPHLWEREQPSPSTPSANEQAASLSRSELNRQLDVRSSPEQLNVPEPDPAATAMRPSETSAQRSQTRRTQLRRDFEMPRANSQPDSQVRMNRAEAAPQPLARQQPSALSSRTRSDAAPAPRGSPKIDAPTWVPSREAPAEPTANTTAAVRNRARSAVTSSLSAPSLREPLPTASRSPTRTQSPRRESQWRVPQPSAGDIASSIARDTAGGSTGPPAQSSMPTLGEELLAGVESAPSEAVSPRLLSNQRSSTGRTAPSLPAVGAPQAPSWDATPRLSSGVSGTSPADLARNAATGNAASNDVAGLTGSGRSIQRSRVGAFAEPGALSAPSLAGVNDAAHGGSNLAGESQEPGQLAPGVSELRRSSSGAGLGDLTGVQPASEAQAITGRGLPDGLTRATGQIGSSPGQQPQRQTGQGSLARSAGYSAAPAASPVGVPDVDAGEGRTDGQADNAESLLAQSSRGSRSRGNRGGASATPLALEAPIGPGGVSPRPDSSGALLARRNTLGQDFRPADLEAQRFARQEIGGPLATGQQVAVPKPAFQQRLERLQDRNPLDETSIEPQTELAIERGLAFLAKHQREDGSWRLQDFDTDVLMRSDTAATGLALLAFQGAGYTHKQFKYAQVVDKALQFLKERQTKDGDLYIRQDPASDQNAWLYSHGIASIAVCEAYGMTQDPELKQVAQGAIDFMVASQDPQRGGWRYRPGVGSDTSVSGWFMMAFKSGQLAGLDVPEEVLERLDRYIEKSQVSEAETHLYRYNPFAADTPQQRHGLQPTAVMTSVGLLMRLYTGWRRDQLEMTLGTAYLLEHPPEHGTPRSSKRDTYYWYYATQVLFHMGGERWQRWHDELYPLLINNQVTQGENEGSWDPMLPTPDLWARYGGRLYVTTMNLLSLEVSYRHLPLYDATAPEAE